MLGRNTTWLNSWTDPNVLNQLVFNYFMKLCVLKVFSVYKLSSQNAVRDVFIAETFWETM